MEQAWMAVNWQICARKQGNSADQTIKLNVLSLLADKQINFSVPSLGPPLLSLYTQVLAEVWDCHCSQQRKQWQAVFIELATKIQPQRFHSQGKISSSSNVVFTYEKQKKYRSWWLERCLKLETQWKRNCSWLLWARDETKPKRNSDSFYTINTGSVPTK